MWRPARARLSDAEQRVRKRRRRDLDDEDYEEQIQPRRVSARKASQAAASLDRNRSLLRGAPDKRGAAAGPATKKAVNRMESMGYGVRAMAIFLAYVYTVLQGDCLDVSASTSISTSREAVQVLHAVCGPVLGISKCHHSARLCNPVPK